MEDVLSGWETEEGCGIRFEGLGLELWEVVDGCCNRLVLNGDCYGGGFGGGGY